MTTKTTDPLQALTGTAPATRRIQHARFVRFSTREDRFSKKRVSRTTARHKDKDGYVLLEQSQEEVLENKVAFYGEYAAYTHNLEGCPRQLLTYILFHELDPFLGTYRFTQQTVARFNEYSRLIGGKQHTASTIAKANRTLVEKNIVQNVNRGVYMVNPMIGGSSSQDVRRRLINAYTGKLLDNGKDPVLHFLPVYEDARQN